MRQTFKMHGYMKAYVFVSYTWSRVYMHLYVHDGVNICVQNDLELEALLVRGDGGRDVLLEHYWRNRDLQTNATTRP